MGPWDICKVENHLKLLKWSHTNKVYMRLYDTHKSATDTSCYKYKYFFRAQSQNILYHIVSSHYRTPECCHPLQFDLHEVLPCHLPT